MILESIVAAVIAAASPEALGWRDISPPEGLDRPTLALIFDLEGKEVLIGQLRALLDEPETPSRELVQDLLARELVGGRRANREISLAEVDDDDFPPRLERAREPLQVAVAPIDVVPGVADEDPVDPTGRKLRVRSPGEHGENLREPFGRGALPHVIHELDEPQDTYAHYAASYLFFDYAAQRFGPEFIRDVIHAPRVGIAGVQAVLDQRANGLGFEDLFADWVVASYLNDPAIESGRYAYANEPTFRITRIPSLAQYPATQSVQLPPYSASYYQLQPASGNATLYFTGTTTAKLLPVNAQRSMDVVLEPRRLVEHVIDAAIRFDQSQSRDSAILDVVHHRKGF